MAMHVKTVNLFHIERPSVATNHRYRLHWVTEMSINTSFGTCGFLIERQGLNVQSASSALLQERELLP
jgi:hypothetical protein